MVWGRNGLIFRGRREAREKRRLEEPGSLGERRKALEFIGFKFRNWIALGLAAQLF